MYSFGYSYLGNNFATYTMEACREHKKGIGFKILTDTDTIEDIIKKITRCRKEIDKHHRNHVRG